MSWGNEGFSHIVRNALSKEGWYAHSSTIRALAYAASGSLESFAEGFSKALPKLYERLDFPNGRFKSKEFIEAARRALFEYSLNTEPEVPAPYGLVSQLGTLSVLTYDKEKTERSANANNAYNAMFCAILSRWFRLNDKSLSGFANILQTQRISEENVHQYLARHPYILEPFYASIWSKVSLGESLIADFLIRLMDDSYIVVEIEKPSDAIISKNGDLSAKTTHAIRQVLEYRDWIASNELYARKRFDNIWRPTGLVVIGMESNLTPTQAARLKQENESRHGMVKVVGFDWLYHRADAIHNNIINYSLERFEIS
jgi:hypothetical protein